MAEQIIQTNIAEQMRDSYLEYAMSVIVGRALPDVRDGLKPVHRRVLYAMHDQGNVHNKPYRKSARVVGDVIGKYHPHGDSAVYDTIVRMTQDFSLRYPLIDGQGNFGSVDGDSAAAMRYTEIRMERITHDLLADLDRETVDFIPNYDSSTEEPVVLPSKVPNLLVNGSTGIAVGMSSNIPPHNLSEVIDAFLYYIDHRETVTLAELMDFLPGPDFPTGGAIIGNHGIYEAYSTGRGIIKVRAKHHIEKIDDGRDSIIVTEIPYMVNKASLLEKIAGLVREKKIEGITDLRDESDRKGMRIYIQIRRNDNPDVVWSNLLKQTALQSSFGIIMLAIVDYQPKILPLIQVLRLFLEHRINIITRRIQFDLKQALAKAHILEGLTIALNHLDEVFTKIKAAADQASALAVLQEGYGLSEKQAQAILDMKLQRLTGLEQGKIRHDYEENQKAIQRYRGILADEEEVLAIIREESREIQQKYGDARRSELVEGESNISIEELIDEEPMVVTISHSGYIKRCAVDEYRLQKRGGRGRSGMSTKDDDFVEKIFVASTHDYLLAFTNTGRVFCNKVYELPLASPTSRGKAIINLFPLQPGEKVCTYLNVSEFKEDHYILMCTAKGICKKTDLLAFAKIRSVGIRGINLDDDDSLIAAQLTDGKQEIFFATLQGMGLRVHEDTIRPMGRAARGVIGVRLREEDRVVSALMLVGTGEILTVTKNGYGKKTEIAEYPLSKNRGNLGVLSVRTSERNGLVVGALEVEQQAQVMLITQQGTLIRIETNKIPTISRATQGVRLINVRDGEHVIDLAKVADDDDSGEKILLEDSSLPNQLITESTEINILDDIEETEVDDTEISIE